jgi:hypothetical protein
VFDPRRGQRAWVHPGFFELLFLHLLVRTAELGHAACSVSFLPVVWWLLLFASMPVLQAMANSGLATNRVC